MSNQNRALPTRREVLAAAGAAVTLAALTRVPGAWAAPRRPIDHPFTLGVASGDPAADSVVLWTRLAPQPLTPDGGMPPRPIPVSWELAEDASMRRVIGRGVELATPALGHSVHVEPAGLRPGREYWYRFRTGDHISEIGRTKTLPPRRSSPARLDFAFASCQHFQTGYYTAYKYLIDDDPDLVVFLGDYIYEYERNPHLPRPHYLVGSPTDVDTFRVHYGQYKSDPDLRAAHAAVPFVCTWDDHDVMNDYAGDIPQPATTPDFHARRAAGYQVFYEHLPLRNPGTLGDWANLRVYRRFTVGDLATFSVLDTRQYRDDHPCDDGTASGNLRVDESCSERHDIDRTILGDPQRTWLLDGLRRSTSRWNVLAQQVLFAELDQCIGLGGLWEVDAWDGYTADRRRIVDLVREARIPNTVVITGDTHSHLVNDIKPEFTDPNSPVVATELAGSGISSPSFEDLEPMRADNPHVKFTSARNGYVRVSATRDALRADLRSMRNPAGAPTVQPTSTCFTEASYLVESGRPGAVPA